jgi:hypothetical protein
MSAATCSLSPDDVGGAGWGEEAPRRPAQSKAPLTPILSPGAAGRAGDNNEIHA